jgi:hypothetical protein
MNKMGIYRSMMFANYICAALSTHSKAYRLFVRLRPISVFRSCDFSALFFTVVWMWKCKGCSELVSSRFQLLHHYKLKHPHYGRTVRYLCTYIDCPCAFKTWNALIVHQSHVHSTEVTTNLTEKCSFTVCGGWKTSLKYKTGKLPRSPEKTGMSRGDKLIEAQSCKSVKCSLWC